MHVIGRAGASRRVRVGAAVLALLLAADGVAAYAFGAPDWLALLYIALGLTLGAFAIWLGQRRPAAPPARAQVPGPVAVAERRAIGYVCVTGASNGDPNGQSGGIKACCEGHGLKLTRIVHDVEAAGGEHQRPSLAWALEEIAERRADVLVVARLKDLALNVATLPPLLSWFDDDRRTLIAIDLRLDTSTEAGRLAAMAVAGVGGWERERISARTRRGLEAARSRGAGQGRTAVADIPELHERIAAMREQGMTLQAIADTLNEDGVPTLRGGAKWRPSSVQRATGYQRPSTHGRGIELPSGNPFNA